MAIKTVQVGPRVAVAEAAALVNVYRPVSHPYDKGAIYDNSAHVLSEGYASNAAAQAAFPLTTAWLTATGGSAITTADTFDWAATQEAILALPATGGVVGLPRGVGWLSRGLVVGDGTQTAMSTRHGVTLVGHGQPQYMGSDLTRPTLLRPIASGFSGSAMLTIQGPIRCCRFADFGFDGYDLVDCCIQMYHPESSNFERLLCARANVWQMRSELRSDYNPSAIPWGASNNRFVGIKMHMTYTHGTASGWMFGESNASGAQREDWNFTDVHNCWINGNPTTTGVGLQIGAVDACTFHNLRTLHFASGKALRVKPSGSGFMDQYPDNVIFRECWFNAAASGQGFWDVDESLGGTWSPLNGGLIFRDYGQETDGSAGVPEFPSDSRVRGNTMLGEYFNWAIGSSATFTRVHYDVTGAYAVPAPSGTPEQYVVSIKQDATGGHAVTWNSVFKFVENFEADRRANYRSIYTFLKVSSEYHLLSAVVGVA